MNMTVEYAHTSARWSNPDRPPPAPVQPEGAGWGLFAAQFIEHGGGPYSSAWRGLLWTWQREAPAPLPQSTTSAIFGARDEHRLIEAYDDGDEVGLVERAITDGVVQGGYEERFTLTWGELQALAEAARKHRAQPSPPPTDPPGANTPQ